MKNFIFVSICVVLMVACGGSTEIAGISDKGGCGLFEANYEELVQVVGDDCPFDLAFRFTVQQNGCRITWRNAAPTGDDIPGVINDQGFYGLEIQDINGAVYECQGDAVEDIDFGSYLITCEIDPDALCRIEAVPL